MSQDMLIGHAARAGEVPVVRARPSGERRRAVGQPGRRREPSAARSRQVKAKDPALKAPARVSRVIQASPPGRRRAPAGRRVLRCGRTGTGRRCPRSPRRRSGASQNTHSWAGAPSPLKNATPVDRAGLTDVFEIGIEIRWISVSVRPIAKPAKPFGARSSVDAEDDEQEHAGQDDLGDDHRHTSSSRRGSGRRSRWRPCCRSRSNPPGPWRST